MIRNTILGLAAGAALVTAALAPTTASAGYYGYGYRSYYKPYYGYGYFASALLTFLIGAMVTFRELGRIPYHTFITQPPTARAAPEDEGSAAPARLRQDEGEEGEPQRRRGDTRPAAARGG